MRILLAITLVLSLAACGKKKAPQAPADNAASEAAPAAEGAEEEKSTTAPIESEDAAPAGADPEEGGE